MRQGVLKNFTKFTGKRLRQPDTVTQVLSSEFCKFFKNTFFTEHLWTTASRVVKNERDQASLQILIRQSIQTYLLRC